MKTLFRTCVLLIIGLVAIYTAGCGGDIEQETDPVVFDTAPAGEESSNTTNGKPITVTDETFDTVVLEAELPVVLELGAEW